MGIILAHLMFETAWALTHYARHDEAPRSIQQVQRQMITAECQIVGRPIAEATGSIEIHVTAGIA